MSDTISVSGLGLLVVIAGMGCHTQVRDPSVPEGPPANVAAANHEPARDVSSHPEPANPEPARNDPAHGEPAHENVDAHRLELVARAEKSLAQSWPLDYQRPFTRRDGERPVTAALYLEACRAGDKPSCRIAAMLGGWAPGPALTLVIANCRSGDLSSCRAIPVYSASDDLPGAAGRSTKCEQAGDCDTEALRFECLAGFALSCSECDKQSRSRMPDGVALSARTAALARAACQDRYDVECSVDGMSEAEKKVVLERWCPLEAGACNGLSAIYLRAGAVESARDLVERTCQYGGKRNSYDCYKLGEAYLARTYPEPVPGRGEALIAWVCSDSVRRTYPVCKEWVAKHPARRRASR